jgi:hypothetical protein
MYLFLIYCRSGESRKLLGVVAELEFGNGHRASGDGELLTLVNNIYQYPITHYQCPMPYAHLYPNRFIKSQHFKTAIAI